MNVKHLVLSGGGLKGIAFLGVLEYLQRHQKLRVNAIETFAGCSAGSLICGLLVAGFSVAEIFKVLHDCDVESLTEPDVTLLLTEFGIESGRRIMSVFTEMFRQKGFASDVTFLQMYQATGKRLIITATCVGKGIRYFDYLSEPNLSVLLALRMSISIPLLFTAVQYQGDYYIDGGLLDNVPMVLLKDKPIHEVLTIRTGSSPEMPDTTTAPIQFPGYLFSVISTLLKELEKLKKEHCKPYNRLNEAAIVVCAGPHKLSVTNQDKVNLFRIGYNSAKRYVSSDGFLLRQIASFPDNVQHLIWFHLHRYNFKNVIGSLTRDVQEL